MKGEEAERFNLVVVLSELVFFENLRPPVYFSALGDLK